VIDHLRRASGLKDVGHAGTLDPLAQGVLLCLLGRATRLTPYLQELPKAYRGVIQFGVRTDTQDADGEVFYQKPAPHLTLEQVRAAAEQFKGRIMQIPPMFSALRVQGKKLHELAREGKEVPREPRPVHIYQLQILSLEPGDYPTAAFVTRTAIGDFRLEDACTLEQLTDRASVQARLIPIADALMHLPQWTPTPAVLERLELGGRR